MKAALIYKAVLHIKVQDIFDSVMTVDEQMKIGLSSQRGTPQTAAADHCHSQSAAQ